MLNLAPDIENRVCEYAAAEGVSVDELMARTFPPRSRTPLQKALQLAEEIRRWQAEDAISDEAERLCREQATAQTCTQDSTTPVNAPVCARSFPRRIK